MFFIGDDFSQKVESLSMRMEFEAFGSDLPLMDGTVEK